MSTEMIPEVDAISLARAEQHLSATTAIDREVERLEGQIAEARGYAAEQLTVTAFFGAFPPEDGGYFGRMRGSIGTGTGSLNGFLIMWDARRLQDVTPRVAWLAQRLGKFKIEDYPELGRRTYDFGRVKFCVFFNTFDDKTVCKFLEVGKEEKPIYKLMCGELEAQS